MHMRVNGAGSGDKTFTGHERGVWAHDEVNTLENIGRASAADTDDPTVLDPDAGLADADNRVDEDHVGHQHVEVGLAAAPIEALSPCLLYTSPSPRDRT